MHRPKVFAFDLFGTVFDLAEAGKPALASYAKQLRHFYDTGEYKPLDLPACWEHLPAYPDAAEGLQSLRDQGYTVLTCSNAPFELQQKMLTNARLPFDGIVPLEVARVYKTHPAAYALVCQLWGVQPRDVVFVTGNRTFGDLEASSAIGMQPMLIRDKVAAYADIKEMALAYRVRYQQAPLEGEITWVPQAADPPTDFPSWSEWAPRPLPGTPVSNKGKTPTPQAQEKPDWRLNTRVTPKLKDSFLYGRVGVIVEIKPKGTAFGHDEGAVVRMEDGTHIVMCMDSLMTA